MTVPAGPVPGACLLCGAPLPSMGRCSACGLSEEVGPGRVNPFTTRVLVMLGLVLVAVYAVTLFVVLLAR